MAGYIGNTPGLKTAEMIPNQLVDVYVDPGDPFGKLAQGLQTGYQLGEAIGTRGDRDKLRQQKIAANDQSQAKGEFDLKNARTESRLKNIVMGASELLGLPPEQQMQKLNQRKLDLAEQGLPSNDTDEYIALLEQNPDAANQVIQQTVEHGYQSGILQRPPSAGGDRSTSTQKEWQTYQSIEDPDMKRAFGLAAGFVKDDKSGKIDPTTQERNWEVFKTLEGDEKTQFGLASGFIKTPKEGASTAEIKNFEYWNSMPDGEAKTAVGIKMGYIEDPAEVERKQRDMQIKEEAATIKREKADRETASAEQERKDHVQTTVTTAADVYELTGDLLADGGDLLDPITGYKTPFTFMPTTKNTLNRVNRVVNMLTSENLDKMKGVLTDRDMLLLKSYASKFPVEYGEDGTVSHFSGTKEQVEAAIREVQAVYKNRMKQLHADGEISLDQYAKFMSDEEMKEMMGD